MRRESHSLLQLPSGVFLGRRLLQRGVRGLTLTQSGYSPEVRLPVHAHESAFFSVVLSGCYTERLGRGERERAPYSVAFHPPGEQHADDFHRARSRTLGVELSPGWLERLREAGVCAETPRFWCEGPPQWIAMRLHRELEAGDEASPLAIEGLVLELAGEAHRVREFRVPPRWLKLVEERLRADLMRSTSLAELAELTRLHPVHIARTFRRWHGCTCGEFVRRLRVERARERLASSRASLSQIALEAGFSDQSHFSRCFKRATGLTPGEYRARVAPR
jgi:AraC family transcriptional regulator